MRTTAWLLAIGCVTTPLAHAQPSVDSAATRQLHETMIKPASETIFNVGRAAPRSKDEWAAMSGAGTTLIESGNLMMRVSPPGDRAKWIALTRQLVIVARTARRAADARNVGMLMRTSDRLVVVCESCHAPYRNRGGSATP